MIDIGLLREVKEFYIQNLSLELPSMKAIGIKFFFEYLSKKRNLQNAISLTQQESRRYAKRQMTWFRNSFSYDIIYENLFEDDKKFVLNLIKAFNLL
jgi:tRNA dimethylallyltransferase